MIGNREVDKKPFKYTSAGVHKLDQIDAIRGWAILLVIFTHSGDIFSEMPYPVKKFTNFGWYGVQLFFIASAFTLLLSWHGQNKSYFEKVLGFNLQRFFRIAPMYYLAALLFFYLNPPGDKSSFIQLLLSLSFINSWSPSWIPTTLGGWMVVPGGWSISVEYCFYFMFPILAGYFSSLKKSLLFVFIAFFILVIAHPLGEYWYADRYAASEIDNFLYFWLPNQLVIFALGFLAFYIIKSNNAHCLTLKIFLTKYHLWIFFCVVGLYAALSQIGGNHYFIPIFPYFPMHLIIGIIFVIFLISLLACPLPSRIIVNRFVIEFGKISFSAYILHFSVLHLFKGHAKMMISSTGYDAIFYFSCVILPVTLVCTFILSKLTYQFIELPFIGLGRKLTKKIIFYSASYLANFKIKFYS